MGPIIRVLTVAVAVAAVVTTAAAGPPKPIKMHPADALKKYCGGKTIETKLLFKGSVETKFKGDCGLVLGEYGQLGTGKGGKIEIDGHFTIAHEARAAGSGEVQIERDSTLVADMVVMVTGRVEVKSGATVKSHTQVGIIARDALRIKKQASVTANDGKITLETKGTARILSGASLAASKGVEVYAPEAACDVSKSAVITEQPAAKMCMTGPRAPDDEQLPVNQHGSQWWWW